MSMKRVFILKVTKVLALLALLGLLNPGGWKLGGESAVAQASAPVPSTPAPGDLLNPSFDVKDVYQVRDVSILLEDLHISISDGTLAFMRSVNGHVTGAVFEGVGEVLLVPPNRAERTSLALFTDSAVLEQRFQSAYLRFSDEQVVEALRAGLRGHPDDAQEFVTRWQEPVMQLARADSLLILQSMTSTREAAARFLHMRMGGTSAGIIDVFFDTNTAEQISVAQATVTSTASFFDIWTSFPMRSVREAAGEVDPATRANFEMSDYVLRVKVQPPTDLTADAEFTLTPHHSGQRTVVLEFSPQAGGSSRERPASGVYPK
jgi:hypothetical protein